MERLHNLAARIDGLSVRERALIMATVLVILYVVWDVVLMNPLNTRESQLTERLASTRVEIDALSREAAAIIGRQGEDPDAENRAILAGLHRKLADIKLELQRAARNLVPPEQMADVLESVLRRSRGVEFLRLEGLGASSILRDLEASPPKTSVGRPTSGDEPAGVEAAYKHGLVLEFKAGYLETLALLRELESLPWVFFWDSVKLGVESYPTSRVAITVFTLSWNKDWIGI